MWQLFWGSFWINAVVIALILYGPIRQDMRSSCSLGSLRDIKLDKKSVVCELRRCVDEMLDTQLSNIFAAFLVFTAIVCIMLCPVINVIASFGLLFQILSESSLREIIKMFSWSQK